MLIECPSCHTRARLSDDKAGSKVRCPQCERVWVAGLADGGGRRSAGGPSNRGADDTTRKIVLGIGGIVLVALFFYWKNNAPATEALPAAPEVSQAAAPAVDNTGWDSELVKVVRAIHRDAAEAAEGRLLLAIHGELTWGLRRRAAQDAAAQAESAADSAGHESPGAERADSTTEAAAAETYASEWEALTRTQQADFVLSLVDALVRGEQRALVAERAPFDGSVIEEGDSTAIVRVQADPIDLSGGADAIWIQWLLAKDGGRWKAYSWERWISPEEQRAQRSRKAKRIKKRTLSDGSFVIESDVRPLPHLEGTTPQQATRIEQLVAQRIDLDARPRVRTEADRELQAIGKPAIPHLLTQLATIPLETDEQAMQLNLIHMTLTDMTGYITTFKVHELLGATRERQESGLKQWFGWYDRKFKRFEEKQIADPFEGLIVPTEAERRRMERDARNDKR
ncbi:MAG: zinc-ribbon domain-containing protein [Planctomycetota bacterium]|jgi:predicted Zn finger-like uncharacterized protein|nr:zinc-ribbon domain-containing protein [Planctomycetota bacterium]